ncbi:MAG: hypothetical protein ACTSWM_07835, partial [Alphaproteobacteria bacterium]
MWQEKVIFATLSLALMSACSLQTTQAPTFDAIDEVTQSYAVYFPFDSAKFDDGGMETAISSALASTQQTQSVRIQ